MVIKNVNLETVCGITSKLPDHTLPEIAFAGKSNVGKSSLINALMNRKALARTSAKPGKTQTINFYNINEEMYLCNTGISDKYNDNYFAWTKFGLIPVIRYSDIVFCGTTFISVDMLNEKQKELWDSVHSKLLEQDLLRGNRE